MSYGAQFDISLSPSFHFQLIKGGWIIGHYSFKCQPVDYSNSESALLMAGSAYIYYLSKFSEFIDTVSNNPAAFVDEGDSVLVPTF